MKEIAKEIAGFFKKQQYVIITTLDEKGFPHSSCKGLVKIEDDRVFLLDLYKQRTYRNLKKNRKINVTAVDAESFIGYCLKGTARIVKIEAAHKELLNRWEENVVKRVSHRVISHLHGERSSVYHPESLMPHPQYIIVMTIKEIVDLVPGFIKS